MKVVLAVLPFVFYGPKTFLLCVPALFVAVFFWVTTLLFWSTKKIFPRKLLKWALILWLGVAVQAAGSLWGLEPYWIVSTFLLIPTEFFHYESKARDLSMFSPKVKKYFLKRFLEGISFVALVLLLVLFHTFISAQSFLNHFPRPAGLYFLICFLAILWKNQPRLRS